MCHLRVVIRAIVDSYISQRAMAGQRLSKDLHSKNAQRLQGVFGNRYAEAIHPTLATGMRV